MLRSICSYRFHVGQTFQLIIKLVGLVVLVSFNNACTEENNESKPPVKWSKEQSTTLNKELAAQEFVDIQLFVDRLPHLNFKDSGSGLRMAFVKDSAGVQATSGQTAFVSFKIALLDGTVAYETEANELNRFKVDRSEVESGVQEAIKLMSVGDHCKLIVPSHLGHGLVGDMNKIPPLTPLVIDLKLIKLK